MQVGDIIRHKSGGKSYVVTDDLGERYTAVRTVDICNPHEWEVVATTEESVVQKPTELKKIDWSQMPAGIWVNLRHGKNGGWIKRRFHSVHNGRYKFLGTDGNACDVTFSDIELLAREEFTFWSGGQCPVPEGVQVEVVRRNGSINSGEGVLFPWQHPQLATSQWADIIAYRIIGISPGYTS